MPQLGQGRNMVRGGNPYGGASRLMPMPDLGAQQQQRGDLGAYGGLSGLVSQLRGAYGGGGELSAGGSRTFDESTGKYRGLGGGVDLNRGYAGNDPMFGPPLGGGGGDTFDPGGRSAATLQAQYAALSPEAQQGYAKQYAAASPQMQASVLNAMGLGQRETQQQTPGLGRAEVLKRFGEGIGDQQQTPGLDRAGVINRFSGGPMGVADNVRRAAADAGSYGGDQQQTPGLGRAEVLKRFADAGPMGPAAVADNARRLGSVGRGLPSGNRPGPSTLGGGFATGSGDNLPGPSTIGGGLSFGDPGGGTTTGLPSGNLPGPSTLGGNGVSARVPTGNLPGPSTIGGGLSFGGGGVAPPSPLGGGIGGLSGLAAPRPKKALGAAAQDYFG